MSYLIKTTKLTKVLQFILYWIIIYFCFYGISYTEDIETYMAFYSGEEDLFYDSAFLIFRNFAFTLGLDFKGFYFLMIVLMFSAYLFLFVKTKVNFLICGICLILVQYVQIANQIRFFFAIPLFFISIYYLIVEKSKLKSGLFATLAILIHSGIIGLFIFYPLYYYLQRKNNPNDLYKDYFLAGIVGLLFFSFFMNILIRIDTKYEAYLELSSTYLGSILVLVFSISALFLIRPILKIKDNNNLTVKYLQYMCYFPVFFIVLSFSLYQVITARYVNSFFCIWLIASYFLSYRIKKSTYNFLFFVIVCIIIKYFLGNIIGHSTPSYEFDKVTQIIRSIER